jgi:AraC-like DNA-binding protein
MPRPQKEIDPEMVLKLASMGCTTKDIGDVLGCSDQTLNRRFADELAEGRAKLRNRLRMKQVEVALSGNVSMLIWLGKQLLDQTDKMNTTNSYQPIEVIIDGERFTSESEDTETSSGSDEILEKQGET